MPSRPSFPRFIGILLASAVTCSLVGVAGAYPGAPWFQPGQPYDQNFPDPAIIVVNNTYYAYATTTGGSSLPVMSSTDLTTWTAHGDALGAAPAWAPTSGGDVSVWAPTVVQLPAGDFLAAFAAKTDTAGRRCIATARSSSPLGPFDTLHQDPFVCELDPNGALDPFLLVDDESVPWLIWKNEGVPVGHPTLASRRTAFWSRQLTDDGAAWRPGSTTNFLIETTEAVRPWQGTVIENPALVSWDGSYFLTYSANQYDSTAYATGWARCSSPAGPCVEPTTTPMLASDTDRLGPGGPAPFVDNDGILRVGYHGWNPPFTSYPSYPGCDTDDDGSCPESQRYLHIDAICVTEGNAFAYDPEGARFCDVPAGRYYSDAVEWLNANGITTGITDSIYGGDSSVTRGQMATFLWRLMGTPVGPPTPFDDVAPDRFYAEAIGWLRAAGLTTGVTPTRFEPDGEVSRAQMAMFLWRLVGEPATTVASPFNDVAPNAWYSDAIAWISDAGVTTGVTPSRYGPDEAVTRAQMAAFLCRLTATTDYSTLAAPTPLC